jgi:festuclavine dehydrogenase
MGTFQAAELLSAVLGRKITHNKLSREDGVKSWVERGAPEPYAIGLTEMELAFSRGFETEQFAKPDVIKGKVTLKEYIEANKKLWVKN